MKIVVTLLCMIFSGCAAKPQALESVAKAESARMLVPAKRLGSFADYELKSMTLSPAVREDPRKAVAAAELEIALRAKLLPLLDQWRTQPPSGRTGTLLIEPQLAALKVVSAGARFWLGALVGDSSVDMDLLLTDQAVTQQIAKARVARSADSVVGALSIGKSDQNLIDYIVSIAYQYLKDNY